MKTRNGMTLVEFLIVLGFIAIVFVILVPVFIRPDGCSSTASHCQSNMNQIGKAMKMYLSDWDDKFPLNSLGHAKRPALSATVPLSGADVNQAGEPVRFRYGINWVEALYPYVKKVAEGDASSVWVCPTAGRRSEGGTNASVTYAFNANMVGQWKGVIREAGNLMLVRELPGKYDAVLRPYNFTRSSKTPPEDAFLDADELGLSNPKYQLHGDGSAILFADGHVKNFGIAYFKGACQWDSKTKQWFNYVNLQQDAKNRAIAVTP